MTYPQREGSTKDLLAERQRLRLELQVAQLKRQKRLVESAAFQRPSAPVVLTESLQQGAMDLMQVWANLLDRYRDGQQWLSPLSTANDRRAGKDFPFFQNEQDLAIYRGTARILCGTVAYAKGLVRGLRSFVVGTGFTYQAKPKRDEVPKRFVERVQGVLDAFAHRERWKAWERELFVRSIRDGEFLLRHGLSPNGTTWVRSYEPDQLFQPPGESWEYWSFGIRTPKEDTQTHEAYWFGEMSNPARGEEVDASEVIHLKRNTDRSIKRGITDFCFDSYDALNLASKLRQAMTLGASVQASIAGIRQHKTSSLQDVSGFANSTVSTTSTNALTGETINQSYLPPGQFLDIPSQYDYVPPPAASNAEAHVAILDASCRAAAAAWNAPEWLVHSNAQNMGAYTSSLVAESPFVIGVKTEQDEYAWHFVEVMKCVVRNAIEAGELPPNTLELVEITAEPPQVEHRDQLQEAQRDQVEVMGGWKSRQQCAQERGYDWEQVSRENEEYDQQHQGGQGLPMPGEQPPGMGGDDQGGQLPPGLGESMVEARVDRLLLKAGFTGSVRGNAGQVLRYRNGKRVTRR